MLPLRTALVSLYLHTVVESVCECTHCLVGPCRSWSEAETTGWSHRDHLWLLQCCLRHEGRRLENVCGHSLSSACVQNHNCKVLYIQELYYLGVEWLCLWQLKHIAFPPSTTYLWCLYCAPTYQFSLHLFTLLYSTRDFESLVHTDILPLPVCTLSMSLVKSILWVCSMYICVMWLSLCAAGVWMNCLSCWLCWRRTPLWSIAVWSGTMRRTLRSGREGKLAVLCFVWLWSGGGRDIV